MPSGGCWLYSQRWMLTNDEDAYIGLRAATAGRMLHLHRAWIRRSRMSQKLLKIHGDEIEAIDDVLKDRVYEARTSLMELLSQSKVILRKYQS